jgi:hypothetical protein
MVGDAQTACSRKLRQIGLRGKSALGILPTWGCVRIS